MMLAKLSERPSRTQISSVTAREQQGHQRQQHVRHAPQCDEQENGDGDQRQNGGFDEGLGDGSAGFIKANGGAGSCRFRTKHGRGELTQHVSVIWITLGQRLNAGSAVGQHPVAQQIGGQGFGRDLFGCKAIAKPIEIVVQRRPQRRLGPGADARIAAGKTLK